MKLLLRWALNALALLLVAFLFDALGIGGIGVDGFAAAAVAALVLGLVNAFVRPVVKVLALPLTCLTLGLFALVINAALFWLVAEVVPGFRVEGALPALLGALAYSVLAGVLSRVVGD